MEDRDLRKLEQENPITQVALELGIKVQGSRGRCFKSERHQSGGEELTLFFKPGKNIFFCKTCQDVGGSVIDLVCQCRGWDRQRAIEWLSRRAEVDRLTREILYGRDS